MASLNLLNFAMIIIAISTSPTSSQFRRSNPKLLNAIVDAYKSDPSDNQDQQLYFTNLPQAHFVNKALRDITALYNVTCEVRKTYGEFGDSYFPSTYSNKTCHTYIRENADFYEDSNDVEELCFHDDHQFGCQTEYKEMHVVKTSSSGNEECWEYFTQTVGVGCKCNVNYRYRLK